MTKEEWEKIEAALSGLLGRVVLIVEGREITFIRGQVGKNRLGIMMYVDGEFEAKWMSPENNCPESRFLRPKSGFVYSKKQRADLRKLSKKFLKSRDIDLDKKYIIFDPMWPSASSLRKYYEKNFQDIKLIKAL